MYDHRKLGRELELFHSAPLVGAGLPICNLTSQLWPTFTFTRSIMT